MKHLSGCSWSDAIVRTEDAQNNMAAQALRRPASRI